METAELIPLGWRASSSVKRPSRQLRAACATAGYPVTERRRKRVRGGRVSSAARAPAERPASERFSAARRGRAPGSRAAPHAAPGAFRDDADGCAPQRRQCPNRTSIRRLPTRRALPTSARRSGCWATSPLAIADQYRFCRGEPLVPHGRRSVACGQFPVHACAAPQASAA